MHGIEFALVCGVLIAPRPFGRPLVEELIGERRSKVSVRQRPLALNRGERSPPLMRPDGAPSDLSQCSQCRVTEKRSAPVVPKESSACIRGLPPGSMLLRPQTPESQEAGATEQVGGLVPLRLEPVVTAFTAQDHPAATLHSVLGKTKNAGFHGLTQGIHERSVRRSAASSSPSGPTVSPSGTSR